MNTPRLSPFLSLLLIFAWTLPLPAEEPAPEAPAPALYSQAELDQLLAPIALYPDVLLSQVLMAATYPLEVVEASRWSRAHPELKGDEAVQAVQEEDWDESVKALVAFPELIQLMDENLRWTRRLGEAFLAQEDAVMTTAQILRRKALEEGNLDGLENVRVEEVEEQIIIQPREVEVVYVPYYSTRVVYGDWWWHDYPPYYWDPPYYHSGIGFSWSSGFRVSTSFYFSYCDWHHRHIVIRKPHRHPDRYDFQYVRRYPRYDPDAHIWRHNPYHRRTVRYHSPDLRDRFDHEKRHQQHPGHRTDQQDAPRLKPVARNTVTHDEQGRLVRRDRIEGRPSSAPLPRMEQRPTPGQVQPVRRVTTGDSTPRIAGTSPRISRPDPPKPASRPAPASSTSQPRIAPRPSPTPPPPAVSPSPPPSPTSRTAQAAPRQSSRDNHAMRRSAPQPVDRQKQYLD